MTKLDKIRERYPLAMIANDWSKRFRQAVTERDILDWSNAGYIDIETESTWRYDPDVTAKQMQNNSIGLVAQGKARITQEHFVTKAERTRFEREYNSPKSDMQHINRPKEELRKRARIIAKELWATDSDNELSMTDMAGIIFRDLNASDDKTLAIMPKKAETIKTWIRPIAPEYATRPGRRSEKKP